MMKTFCVDDIDDCDLVPCAHCHKLFHPSFLNEALHCESCFSQIQEAEDEP